MRRIDILETYAEEEKPTYSSTLRDLRQNDPEKVRPFLVSFKKAFDTALMEGLENPEELALMEALKVIEEKIPDRIAKLAGNYIEMGDPAEAGKGVAEIVKFLLKRIDPANRSKSIQKLKYKIFNLNESEISMKKTPPSSSMGQSITFIKTILNGHDAKYIRSVLNNICRNL